MPFKPRPWFFLPFIVPFIALMFTAPAHADCSDPPAPEGRLVYNGTYKVAQFCDGTNWISMAGGSTADARIGALAAGKWCVSDGGAINCTQDAPITVAGSNRQVLFNDNGVLAGAAQLFWNKANNRLGVGTTLPNAALDIVRTGDGEVLLRLSSERPWQFEQFNSAENAALDLRSTVDGKSFNIKNNAGGIIAIFHTRAITPSAQFVSLVPEGGRVGIGTVSPTDRLDLGGGNIVMGWERIIVHGDGVNTHRTAACPAGKRVTGGGCDCGSYQVLASRPDTDTRHYCVCNGPPASGIAAAWALCANLR